MKLIRWSYMRRNQVKGVFDCCPDSFVIFKRIKNYYFIHSVDWKECAQIIKKEQLEEMEYLLNKEMGFLEGYLRRRSSSYNIQRTQK
ncbi:hypothetical protein DFO73_12519 [Cytobacillus oceanisediminis]|jgi:hypothetical protein|uniref:Uncharacterized protein n=1 Tax=Cytobacillus oceanisediminis TaxID=665099 RepID=A0A2V2ZKY5_9BACI|nr:hypothetical protein DFO73_12519 [Cytobacillus oceanisediminis]